jgi:hypothetical protein
MDLTPHQDDHEAKMARADLFKLAQYSFKLFKMIHEDQELEGWVQAKITKAADYIASVYHYMEYEMKFSEYGEQLENSDVFQQMPESQRIAIETMLTEAKETMKKLTAAQAKKLKKKEEKVKESAKPDFADLDDDGDEEEPMKKAAKDAKKEKKVKEGWDDMLKAVKDRSGPQPSGGSGIKKGSRYGGSKQVDAPEKDEEEKPKKAKKVKEGEGRLTIQRNPDGTNSVTSSTGRVQGTYDNGQLTVKPAKGEKQSAQPIKQDLTPEEAKKDPRYKTDPEFKKEVDAAMQIGVNEAAKKAKKDYDGDGKIESGKDEYLGSKIAAAKKAGKMEETSKKCNHSAKGKSCPVHGMKECSGMYEAERKAAVKPSAGLSAAKKSSIVKKAKSGGDIGKPGKSFDKVAAKAGGGEKGKKIAAAAMWKNAARESVELKPVVVAESAEMARLKQLTKILNG